MQSKLFLILLFFTLSFLGCSEDVSTEPTTTNVDGSKGTISLSGDASGTYEAIVGFINNGDGVAITVADNDGIVDFIITSNQVKTGTFSVPDQYEILYSNSKDTVMAEFNTGSVTIDEISATTVKGSFTGSGYPLYLMTFTTDSTKTINASGTFSLN